MLLAVVIVLLTAVDQLVKYLVKTYIPLGGTVEFIPHVLGLHHIENTGAAFSILSGARWFFVILTAAFIIFALWVLYTKKITHPMGRWTLALVIAGAFGNLIDRAVFGYVVDMFEVQFMNFAIFNVADVYVVVGGILFCIYFAFLHDRSKKKVEDHADSE